jgi:hypothetical protein
MSENTAGLLSAKYICNYENSFIVPTDALNNIKPQL